MPAVASIWHQPVSRPRPARVGGVLVGGEGPTARDFDAVLDVART